MLRYHIFETSWGYCGVLLSEKGIVQLSLPVSSRDRLKKLMVQEHPEAVSGDVSTDPLARRLIREIREYFDGRAVDLDFPLDLSGSTAFQRRIYHALRKVGYGETKSYGKLAAGAGLPSSARAAAGTVARNCIPLVIPCHRIIRSDGSIGGFSGPGGIKMKKRLLEMEARVTTPA